jgi:hypothetical protein
MNADTIRISLLDTYRLALLTLNLSPKYSISKRQNVITITEDPEAIASLSTATVYSGSVDETCHLGKLLSWSEIAVFPRGWTTSHELQTFNRQFTQMAILGVYGNR